MVLCLFSIFHIFLFNFFCCWPVSFLFGLSRKKRKISFFFFITFCLKEENEKEKKKKDKRRRRKNNNNGIPEFQRSAAPLSFCPESTVSAVYRNEQNKTKNKSTKNGGENAKSNQTKYLFVSIYFIFVVVVASRKTAGVALTHHSTTGKTQGMDFSTKKKNNPAPLELADALPIADCGLRAEDRANRLRSVRPGEWAP